MAKRNDRKNEGRFAGIPLKVMDHPDYVGLGFSSRALLLEIARQYNRANNGKLCATFSQMERRGWKSEQTLSKCLKELLAANLITCTKRGTYGNGKREPNFYAINWQPIDDIPGFTMDVKSTVLPVRKFSIELREVRNSKAA